jgi:hypothetical protein
VPTCHTAPSLRQFVPESLHASQFFFSRFFSCDVCDRPRLLSSWLNSRGDYSLSAPAAPSLRPIVPSDSLIRGVPVHMYHHHLYSKVLKVALLKSLLLFQRGTTIPHHPVTPSNPVEDQTIRFWISSSTLFLTILPEVFYFLRRLAPRSFMLLLNFSCVCSLLESSSFRGSHTTQSLVSYFHCLFSTVGPS